MNFKPVHFILVLLLLAGGWVGRAAWRAHKDVVTLNVREMDVAKLIKKIERQTWETILVQSAVTGRVTLHVRNAPLEPVLDLVADQVSARSGLVYPIYRTRGSLKALQKLAKSPPAQNTPQTQWTNYAARGGRFGGGFRGGPGGGGGGGFGFMQESTNQLITLKVQDKDPSLAALTLGFATRAQVVPEDGIPRKVNLDLENVTREEAIRKLAKNLDRNWNSFYVMQATRDGFGRGGPREGGPREGERPEGDDAARQERMAARMDALTPEQRARMEEMRNLSPEERQQLFQTRMEDPAVQNRMAERSLNNIRNSTPEQMVERKRQRQRMRDNFRRDGQGGQPGQPGQPGPPQR